MRWFDDESNPTPFHRALEETRRLATHAQAIIVAIDQYAEAATGNANTSGTNRTEQADRAPPNRI